MGCYERGADVIWDFRFLLPCRHCPPPLPPFHLSVFSFSGCIFGHGQRARDVFHFQLLAIFFCHLTAFRDKSIYDSNLSLYIHTKISFIFLTCIPSRGWNDEARREVGDIKLMGNEGVDGDYYYDVVVRGS